MKFVTIYLTNGQTILYRNVKEIFYGKTCGNKTKIVLADKNGRTMANFVLDNIAGYDEEEEK